MADSEQYLSLFSGPRDHVPIEPQKLVDTISRQLNVIQAGDDCEHNLVFGGEKKVCLMCQFQNVEQKPDGKCILVINVTSVMFHYVEVAWLSIVLNFIMK